MIQQSSRFAKTKTVRILFIQCADVAQLAEQLICNQQVIGSSPIIGFVPLGAKISLDL